MLFDLRGKGRRRTIKVIYLGLAIILAGGLIGFGIGGNGGGGIVDALQSENGGGSDNDVVQQRLEAAQAATQRNPQDARAWAELADVRFQTSNSAEYYNSTVGQYTDEGKRILRQAQEAWDKHVELAGENADGEVANKMAIALGPNGLQDYDAAVAAAEIAIEADDEPTAARYVQLSAIARQAGQTRKADLAEQRALDLAKTKAERDEIKAQIALAQQQAPEPVGGTQTQPAPLGG